MRSGDTLTSDWLKKETMPLSSSSFEVRDEFVDEVFSSCERHIKKYGFRHTSLAEFRKKVESE